MVIRKWFLYLKAVPGTKKSWQYVSAHDSLEGTFGDWAYSNRIRTYRNAPGIVLW